MRLNISGRHQLLVFFFFFQAEDGIRDYKVTGVQTCALPIYTRDTTSGREGLDLLSEIVALDSTVPVIVMTAWANIELAVEAMRRGARDFIQDRKSVV